MTVPNMNQLDEFLWLINGVDTQTDREMGGQTERTDLLNHIDDKKEWKWQNNVLKS